MATKSPIRTLKFTLKPLELHGKKIPIEIVAKSLDDLQSAVYHITTLNLQKLSWKDKEIQLLSPLTLKIYYQDDLWVMENENLGIICAERDYNRCLEDVQEEFFFLWEKYGKADVKKLTEGARKLKNKILKLIEEESC